MEQEESENKGESMASVKQEEHAPEPDSEDSFTPERAVEAIQATIGRSRIQNWGDVSNMMKKGEVSSPHVNPREARCLVQRPQGDKNTVHIAPARGKKSERKI